MQHPGMICARRQLSVQESGVRSSPLPHIGWKRRWPEPRRHRTPHGGEAWAHRHIVAYRHIARRLPPTAQHSPWGCLRATKLRSSWCSVSRSTCRCRLFPRSGGSRRPMLTASLQADHHRYGQRVFVPPQRQNLPLLSSHLHPKHRLLGRASQAVQAHPMPADGAS